jgi:phage shock protein A
MRLLDRILFTLKATGRRLAGDLFQEEVPTPAEDSRAKLAAIRRQVEGLAAERGRAIAAEANARQEWQSAAAAASALEAQVDEALLAGQEDTARTLAARLNAARRKAAELEQVCRQAGEIRAYWDGEVAALTQRLQKLSAQAAQLETRGQSLESVSDWELRRKDLHRELDALQAALDRLQVQGEVRQDRMAASSDLRQAAGKDSHHDTDR